MNVFHCVPCRAKSLVFAYLLWFENLENKINVYLLFQYRYYLSYVKQFEVHRILFHVFDLFALGIYFNSQPVIWLSISNGKHLHLIAYIDN